jgi:hypothetical protein
MTTQFDKWGRKMDTGLDARDAEILTARAAALDAVPGPRCGDYVVFSDGVTRRVSYLWPDGVQTSAGGSWYLGNGFCSFSGSLYRSTPLDLLTLTEEKRPGDVWFFHRDHWTAHNGVHTQILFRVYAAAVSSGAR